MSTVLIGPGRVGTAILEFAEDSMDWHVLDVGQSIHSLNDDKIDTAIIACPGYKAHDHTIACLSSGMNVVDVSFHDHETDAYGKVAEDNGVWYMPDAGFAPGIMNMMIRMTQLNCTDPILTKAWVGCLPIVGQTPWRYASTWNIEDHLSEYVRPARFVRNGEIRSVPPLGSILHYDRQDLTLEAFQSDGLRTLLRDPGVPNLYEYTLRHPGFLQSMQVLESSGMLRPENIGKLADALIFSQAWPEEEDFCRIEVQTYGNGFSRGTLNYQRPENIHSAAAWCTAVGAVAAYKSMPSLDTTGLQTIEQLTEYDNYFLEKYLAVLKDGGLNIEWESRER